MPAEFSTIVLPPDAYSMSTASCVTSGAVTDTGNVPCVTNNLEHVLNFTGENVQLSGVHGDAIKCAGVIIGFPCVDMHGNQRIISCPDTGLFFPQQIGIAFCQSHGSCIMDSNSTTQSPPMTIITDLGNTKIMVPHHTRLHHNCYGASQTHMETVFFHAVRDKL